MFREGMKRMVSFTPVPKLKEVRRKDHRIEEDIGEASKRAYKLNDSYHSWKHHQTQCAGGSIR